MFGKKKDEDPEVDPRVPAEMKAVFRTMSKWNSPDELIHLSMSLNLDDLVELFVTMKAIRDSENRKDHEK